MKAGGRHFTTPFILLLCCIFAGTVLAVLLLGVDAYRSIAEKGMDGYGERTCLAYIAAKARHYDSADSVSVTDFGGVSALSLSEELGGDTYVTLIYLWEGELRELFMLEGLDLPPEAGSVVGVADSLHFSDLDGLVSVTCDAGNGETRILIKSRSSAPVN